MKLLTEGDFVRVLKDSEYKPGADGMVVKDFGDEVGLLFGTDRHNQFQNVVCVGTELWHKTELDLTTVES